MHLQFLWSIAPLQGLLVHNSTSSLTINSLPSNVFIPINFQLTGQIYSSLHLPFTSMKILRKQTFMRNLPTMILQHHPQIHHSSFRGRLLIQFMKMTNYNLHPIIYRYLSSQIHLQYLRGSSLPSPIPLKIKLLTLHLPFLLRSFLPVHIPDGTLLIDITPVSKSNILQL